MNIKLIISLIAVTVVGFLVYQKQFAAPALNIEGTKTAAANASQKTSAASVLNIDPKIRSIASVTTPAIMPKNPLSADMQLLRDRKDWPAIYERAKNGAQTGEALFLQAELLERCAKREPDSAAAASANPNAKKPEDSREAKRDKFVQSLTGSEAEKTIRIQAYDALRVDACGKLGNIAHSKDEVARLLKAAADAGDVRARAWQTSGDIMKSTLENYYVANNIKPDADGKRPETTTPYLVTDPQWDAIREQLASGDPMVFAELRNILSSTLKDASVRIGPDNVPIENRAFWNAWALAACDLGSNCGPQSQQLLAACATQNRCGSASVQDHTYFFESSPHDAQLVERYRQTILDMVRTGNFSQLNLARGAQQQGNTFLFGGRGR